VIAEVIRSGFEESRHRGSAVLLGAGGREVLYSAGEVAAPMFPRSSNKPMQAAAMRACGLALDGELLALASASHSGEDFHVTGVRKILAGAGLTEDALQCPPSLPLDEAPLWRFLGEGGKPDRVHMNCSGKHAAMLATCVAAGWPTATYTDSAHPLQVALRQALEGLAGEQSAAVGVDGCGAPVFALSLAGLTRAFQALVTGSPGTPERRVADAMRAYPEWTSGSLRTERALMATVPGLLLKVGADGVQAFALADGRAAAFKIEDGSARARDPITVALLRRLGVTTAPGVPDSALDEIGAVPVLGGGRVVGVIRAELPG
jgi:L-asparaginase II